MDGQRPAQPRAAGSTRLQNFVRETAERDQTGEAFELESPRLLEARVDGRLWSKLGATVAYRGELTFHRESALQGGMIKALKRAVTSEMTPLTRIEGQGVCYLADMGKQVTILRLDTDILHVNGSALLAFEGRVDHAVTMHRRMAGWASGGLFSVRLSGRGLVAVVSQGEPLTLQVRPGEPVTTHPGATLAWSAGLSPELHLDQAFKTWSGRGGETFQMVFRGAGFVVVQPCEEVPVLVSGD